MSILRFPEILINASLALLLMLIATLFTGTSSSASATTIVEVRISSSTDDAEERGSGSINLSSNDLELVEDTSGNQTVGMRFNQVNIPRGAKITKAYIQFRVDEVDTSESSLNIFGEDVDNASTFTAVRGSISSRPKTSANTSWAPLPWTAVSIMGPNQRTPNIASIVQEIVTRTGWVRRNSIVIMIQGSGVRTAESFDGVTGGAPLLHVEYKLEGNIPPEVTIELARGSTYNVGNKVSFFGTADDFEDGIITSSLVWSSNIDGVIGFGGEFSRTNMSTGNHIITATAIDNRGLAGSDTTKITIFDEAHIIVGAGDIADDSPRKEATAKLLEDIPGTVITLGDNTYPDGTSQEFTDYYAPTWGRHIARTRPIPGNHDYDTSGAAPYYEYFGNAAGDPDKGYYSYDVGDWHIIALNTDCSEVGGCERYSAQGRWLQEDLEKNPRVCTMAYFHHPKYSSSYASDRGDDFWSILYAAEADVILNGHVHNYERFAPQDPYGNLDSIRGIREFVVGTGGGGLDSFEQVIAPNSEARNASSYGVLKVTLHPTSYAWEFIPIVGDPYTDSGSANCVSSDLINEAPVVNSGLDSMVILPLAITLNGSVVDDDRPSPMNLETSWSMVSGPAQVIFGDSSAVDTTARFPIEGEYVLRLTGDDGVLQNYDNVTITVVPARPVSDINSGSGDTLIWAADIN